MDTKALDSTKVWLVELPPCRVASCCGFGQGPEGIAWRGLFAWMRREGLAVADGRFFGFNNPNPTPGNPNYGYEQWLLLDDEKKRGAEAGEGVEFKDFAGGLYAVTRHRGSPERLPYTWGSLLLWVEGSKYRRSERQWLEDCLRPDISAMPEPRWDEMAFDIYMAIER